MDNIIEPGHELNKLIAVTVMGWKILSHSEPGVVKHLLDENQCEVRPPEFKPYSTDMSAAWLVAERLSSTSKGCFFVAWDRISDMWGAGFDGNVGRTEAQAETAPHAICLAALKLVGYEAD